MLTFLWYLLVTVEVLLALLLILIILLQRSREDGLGLAFGSAMGESLFGTQASTILTKATVALTVLFLLNTIALGRVGSARWSRRQLIGDRIPEGTAAPVEYHTLPSMPAAETAVEEFPAAPMTTEPVEGPADGEVPLTLPLAAEPQGNALLPETADSAAATPPAPAPAP